jgi:hypothetical protein
MPWLHVFLDVRELGAGPFDEQLLRRIARATDFVVVLTPGCLDECQRPGDWLAKEIGHAFDTGRNVVPVAVGGFECPPAQQLPPELVELPRQQWVRYEHEFSDESIERVYRMLRRVRLQALPHHREPRSPRFAVLLPGSGHGDSVSVTRLESRQDAHFR